MAAPHLIETQDNPALRVMEENAARRRARIVRPRWNPKQWHPVYEEVVLMDCLGLARKDIALEKGFTEQHITNICATPQAAIIRELFRKRMAAKYEGTVEERLERITQKAMDRIENVINNDELEKKNPLGLFDRAITVLKATSKIKEAPTTNVEKQLIVSDEQFTKLLEGTKKADEAKRLHSGDANPTP